MKEIRECIFEKDGVKITPGEEVLIVTTHGHSPNVRFGTYLGMDIYGCVVVEWQSKRWAKIDGDYEYRYIKVRSTLNHNRIWSVNHFRRNTNS